MPSLRLILGDQLNYNISSLSDVDKQQDVILLAEVRAEATYVKHHKKKIAFLFSAMRHFAKALCDDGYRVHYTAYDASDNQGSLRGEVAKRLKDYACDQVVVTEAGEYRLHADMAEWSTALGCPVHIRPDNRFFCNHETFKQWAAGKKALRMEFFYRQMRQHSGILMADDKPIGDQWNFDHDNRKALPKKKPDLPQPLKFKPDSITQDVLKLVAEEFADHFGDLEPFWFATTHAQAQAALNHFIEYALPNFGTYQDAMATDEPYLFHSLLSQYINCGLLSPDQVCIAAEQAYHDSHAPLNAVEGFIRQILGWREYVRGLYWHFMPDYATRNALQATRPLPDFYYSGTTDMHCLSQVITMTKREAQSHHIQRLMVTGNFALLAGLDVAAVCQWYLEVYADAYEWVELPNTLGMALFADDGVMASKPYAASGAYINRMSNFCSSCRYNVKEKIGKNACPFNTLYWDFLIRHQQKLSHNNRMALVYRHVDKLSNDERQDIQQQASRFLDTL